MPSASGPFVQHASRELLLEKFLFHYLYRLQQTGVNPYLAKLINKTAQRSFSGFWVNKFRMAVVLPTPKKPETILVGTSAMVSVDLVIDSKSKCFL